MAETFFNDFDPETVDQGGRPAPGKCQLLVAQVEENEGGDRPYVSVVHEVVAHEDPNQVGKTSYNSFSLTGKGARRALLFALATGIVTKQQLAEAKANGQSVAIDYTAAYGTVYFGTLVAGDYNGKKTCRVEWDFLALDAPEAKDYPCSSDFPRPEVAPAVAAPPKASTARPKLPRPSASAKAKATTAPPVQPTVDPDAIPF